MYWYVFYVKRIYRAELISKLIARQRFLFDFTMEKNISFLFL